MLITVTVVGLILVAVLATVAAYFGQTESRAVAGSLLAVRAHWALMGHVHYARSRLRQVPAGLRDAGSIDPVTDPTFDEFANLGYERAGNPIDGLNRSRFQTPALPPDCSTLDPMDPTMTPTQITQCVLNELRTHAVAGGGGEALLFERCWTYPQYSLSTIAADAPAAGVLPNDTGGLDRGGVRLRFELSGLATGAVGSAPPCGDQSAPPPFAAGTDLGRLVTALNVGIFIDDAGGTQQTLADISDLWRSSD